MKKAITFGILALFALILVSSSVYIVNEDEVAVIKTFGEVVSIVIDRSDKDVVEANLADNNKTGIDVIEEKGLHFRIPFIQTVDIYSSKYLTYTSSTETINTADSRRVEVQMYAQYRVIDPSKFYEAVGTKSEANKRMDDDIYPTVINSVNNLEFNEFFYAETLENLLDEKQETLNERMVKEFGIYVSDIGINRKTFPVNNISTIEEKMTKEIEKESAQSIAEGDSEYNQKVARVDAQKAQVIANAVEEAAIIKAEADAIAIRTYQEALLVDLDFYRFIQRMDIYKDIKGSTVFLDKDNAVFSYLNSLEASGGASAPVVESAPVTE
jgi:membrane protease subunit HflC